VRLLLLVVWKRDVLLLELKPARVMLRMMVRRGAGLVCVGAKAAVWVGAHSLQRCAQKALDHRGLHQLPLQTRFLIVAHRACLDM
jgi:hypothetical protein